MKPKNNPQIQEAIYRAEVSKIFLEHGWMVYVPEADVGGVDFLVMNLETEEVRKIQLKGRWTVDKKYQGKNIWMCFSLKDKWYVCKHDIMVEIGLQHGLLLWEQANGEPRNAYSIGSMSKKMIELMSAYQFPKVFEELSKPSNIELIENINKNIYDSIKTKRSLKDRLEKWFNSPNENVHKILNLIIQKEGISRNNFVKLIETNKISKNAYGAVSSLMTDKGNSYGEVLFVDEFDCIFIRPKAKIIMKNLNWVKK
jgi:hypothetical protein